MYGLSDSGWMTSDIFENWFTHHFLVHAPAGRPLLLLIDGHSTHYNASFITKAAHEKVIIILFATQHYPSSTTIRQECLWPFKDILESSYMIRNPGKVVTQYSFKFFVEPGIVQ